VSAWACVSCGGGSASGCSRSSSHIVGGNGSGCLEVSVEELSGSDGAEGEDGESLEHLICLFESYLIDYKTLILFSFCS
jgi:hypothetical protein